jgi:hypothetical protein
LLENASLLYPEVGELQNQILEREGRIFRFKFYFNFQALSKNSSVLNLRSM